MLINWSLKRALYALALVTFWSAVLIVEPSLGQQNGEPVVFAPQINNKGQLSADFLSPTSNEGGDKQVKIQYVNVNGLPVLVQFTFVGPPKILPIATADSYPEGSSINLICTVSGGQRKGLALSWRANGEELTAQRLNDLEAFDNVSIGNDGADISILRINNATNINSGVYTCTAKNPLGQDSTSVKIVINVELKWNKIPKDAEVGLNKELLVECDAIGTPSPTIEWFKHSSFADSQTNSNGTALVAKGGSLKLAKAQHKDSGLYECIARNGVDEDLRKIIQVKVRGK